MLNGIDVSGWQPNNIGDYVDFDFLIAKVSDGTWLKTTKSAIPQIASAKSRGKLWGTYHYAQPSSSPESQAEYYINTLREANLDQGGILVLDFEAEAISKGYSFVKNFCAKIIELTNVKPLVYSNLSAIQSLNLVQVISDLDCGIWVAAYGTNQTQGYSTPISPVAGACMYQFTSAGRLPGYNENLDLNVFYGDSNAWTAYARGGEAAASYQNPLKELEEVVAEVLKGLWGNGAERVARLNDAGYDYDSVQAQVNKAMSSSVIHATHVVKAGETLSGIALM